VLIASWVVIFFFLFLQLLFHDVFHPRKKRRRKMGLLLPSQKRCLLHCGYSTGFILQWMYTYTTPFFHINLSPPPVVVLYCRYSGKSFFDDLTTSDRISSTNVRFFVLRAILDFVVLFHDDDPLKLYGPHFLVFFSSIFSIVF
jgi:hypothetical protein